MGNDVSKGGNAGASGAAQFGGNQSNGGVTSNGGAAAQAGGTTSAEGGKSANGGDASGGAARGGANSGGLASRGGSTSAGGVTASGGASSAGGARPTGGTNAGGQLGAGAGGVAGGAGANSMGGGGSGGAPNTSLPCDIYASGNTPCVAAHSTVRALYAAYAGNLYQVKRRSDNTTKDIGVLTPGGFANAALQDTFCSGTTCDISIIYDQSAKHNHLTPAPGGGAAKSADKPVVASRSKLNVGGHSVYAAYFEGGMGYRNNSTSGIAKGDEAESMYMVTSGTHFNSACCFDYGNAETDNNDDGNGTMEAIYFGNQRNSWGWGNVTPNGDGSIGPWVEADLENGLFAGNVFKEYKPNTPLPYSYVTAMVKGKPGGFAIKGGNATSGALKTMYEGARPGPPNFSGYNPMKKQGAIILGIGGDNSNGSQGTFYEGCMTSGYASDTVDEAVQASIVAAGYGR